ncbi:MAG: GGDEF domain-containing protein [Pirellulales bacterium]
MFPSLMHAAQFVSPVLALSTVALLGYWVGIRARDSVRGTVEKAKVELKRAKAVSRELDRISAAIRAHVESHETSLAQFKQRLGNLCDEADEGNWQQLCQIAEELLRPTMRLANQLSQCHDDLRQQGNKLMSFTDVRTDPLTNLSNRRALDETLAGHIALRARYGFCFSLVIFDIDHFKAVNDNHGHLAGDAVLQSVARILESCVRETDLIARYGGEEFVLLMPQTELDGAALLCERLRAKVAQETRVTVSGGVAAALDCETGKELLARADAALYKAKAAGRNQVFVHRGDHMHPVAPSEPAASQT